MIFHNIQRFSVTVFELTHVEFPEKKAVFKYTFTTINMIQIDSIDL